ncbi:MAG TPA: lysine--tRNA ligase [Candidatus Methylomirabilis sp.]|nr:lysine--tRNA ligase [Candidatus Methylomirabilis sp.]
MSNEDRSTIIHSTGEKEDRLKKLEEFEKAGINPYPDKTERTHSVIDALSRFEDLEAAKETIVLAGRIMIKREFGNLIFAQLFDGTGKIQLAVSKKDLGPDEFKKFDKLVDMGDFIEAFGTCFVTHKGEKSLMVVKWKILAKALLPMPEKWHGLEDEDERFRLRYLDLLTNPEIRDLFYKKAKFWDTVRRFMQDNDFLEVETPTFEITTGGAEANPFITHHDDFNLDVYLRISVGELWQKRLMAAGFPKTFEIGRAYRNEGSSPDHAQEFTNMEFYWGYANYENGMELARELYQKIAQDVFGTTRFTSKTYQYDLAGEWPRFDYCAKIKDETDIDVLRATADEIKDKLAELNVKYEGDSKERLIDTLWKYCRKKITGPAFVINHPKIVSPLAKSLPANPELTERFQIIIAGSEVGNGYSELNDPLEQRARFTEQQKLIDRGDKEAMMPDWDFVEMLEHGMPPTCGFGFGERLFAFLVDKPLRECQLFPLMKPKK